MRFTIRTLAGLTASVLLFIAAPVAHAQSDGSPTSAQVGGGIRAVPSAIEVPDGLKGSEVVRLLKLTNNAAPGQPFRLAVEGDIASWVSFADPDDPDVEIERLVDNGRGTTVLIRIAIPEDASVGLNEGLVTAVLESATDNGTASPVGLGLAIPVFVDVTGELILAGELLSMNVENTEIGLPVRGTVIVRNSGNTTVVPQVTLEVFRGPTSVYRTSLTGSALRPGSNGDYEAVWDTTNAAAGDYRAVMSVSLDALDLGGQEDTFELLPAGSLDRKVVFTSLEVVNEPIAGGVVDVEATTTNPGQAEVSAIFVGELLRGGTVVEQFRSLDYLVRPRDTVVVTTVLDVPENGDYTVLGYFIYEGGETETKQAGFTTASAGEAAAAEPTESNDSASILPWIIAGVLGLILVGLVIALVIRRVGKTSAAGTRSGEPLEGAASESGR